MAKKENDVNPAQQKIFGDLPEPPSNSDLLLRPPTRPVWTENKATLVERYVRYFLFITHHGTYIDGFAGPQSSDHDGMWTAERILELEPKWLRRFYLCDIDPAQCKELQELVDRQPPPERACYVKQGNFNSVIDEILASGDVDKGAVFCLLDQRTFECEWSTLQKIANHTKDGHKIELFYFLAQGWLDRSLKAVTRNDDKPRNWWGRDDWKDLIGMQSIHRAQMVCSRFQDELGYKHVKPWSIYENNAERRIMYFMIHASDHDEAPKLMYRAYCNVHKPPETPEQLGIQIDVGQQD